MYKKRWIYSSFESNQYNEEIMKDKLENVYFISNFVYDEFVKYIKEINI